MSQSSKPPAGGTVISAGRVHPSPAPLAEPMQPVVASHSGRITLDLVGTVLSQRYRVLKKLGEGGMGSVYLAEHTTINKKLAIKVLSPDFSQKPDLVDRFLQEARAASMIDQENVVEITDFGTVPGGTVFFVMEYLNGEDLAATIKREGPLPWERVRPIILQICDALAAAHDAGIIHRDMKPENCYRIRRGSNPDFIKVLDFGIAKVNSDESDGSGGRNLTRTGMIFGTPEYMSPEQAKGERVDHRVDIYAVGIILYELLTGRVPFIADTFMGTLTKHMFEAPPSPASVAPGVHVPPEVEAIILKALQKERDYRFQSMGEMANAIRAVGTGAAPVAVMPEQLAPPTPGRIRYATRDGETIVDDGELDMPPRRSPWPIIGGIVAAAVLLGGVGFYASGRWKPATSTDDPGASQMATNDAPKLVVPETDAPQVDDPPAGEKNEPAVAEPPPEPPPPPTTVALRVETAGVEGTVVDTRDHRELGPTNAALTIPYAEEAFEIEIVAPGREPQRREIRPSADVALSVDLPEAKKRPRKTKKVATDVAPRRETTPPPPPDDRPATKPPVKKKPPSGSPDLKNPFG